MGPNHVLLTPDKASMVPFRVSNLLDNSSTDFDLYIDIQGRLALYARAPYRWNRDELARLLEGGHELLYHAVGDAAKADSYLLCHAHPKVDQGLPPRERVVKLTDAAAELTRILYQHPFTSAAMEQVKNIGSAMVDCIAEDPSCVTALGKLAHHDDYTFYHSARVAAYALSIAMQMSQRDLVVLRDMATGALLHDVGKSRIALAVLHKKGALLPSEWEEMKKHPSHGGDIVASSLLSMMPRQIITGHHERIDGSGYPFQLSGRELLDETKIVAFADVFDALTTNRPYQVSRTPFEALDFIRHRLAQHIAPEPYHALVQLLAGGTGSFKGELFSPEPMDLDLEAALKDLGEEPKPEDRMATEDHTPGGMALPDKPEKAS